MRDEAGEQKKEPNDRITKVFFDPGHYTVMENVGTFKVHIHREGDPNSTVYVDYTTEDGTANAYSDYDPVEGTLVFKPGQMERTIEISVIDDDVFEEDEHFYVRLSNVRYGDGGAVVDHIAGPKIVQLVPPSTATVMILDDDHCGVFNLEAAEHEISESLGEYMVRVTRSSGARGKVILPWRTVDGTAIANKDFEPGYGEIVFDNNQTS